MFKKRDMSSPESFDTLIGTNTVLEGNIESEGTIRVDGKVKGDLKIDGDLYVGGNGCIIGNVYANNVHLSGTVEGNIHSKGVLRVLSTAKLYGDIQVHSLVTDEGGIFQGKCSMLDVPSVNTSQEKISVKKALSGRDYKKSSVLSQIDDEKDKGSESNAG